MIPLMLLLATQAPLPGGTDNGFISTPSCERINWPTLPINLCLMDLDWDEFCLVVAGVNWWNATEAAPVFGIGCEGFTIAVFSDPSPTEHGSVNLSHWSCDIFEGSMYVPDKNNNDAWANTTHLLGDALGLAHDAYVCSIMDPSCASNWYLTNDITVLTNNDKKRLLDAVEM